MNFRTAYVDAQSGHIIFDQAKISLEYIKGWFVIDLISCIPINYIMMLTVRRTQTSSRFFCGRVKDVTHVEQS